MPTTRPANVAHPSWCDPRMCDADAGHADIRHSGEPDRWAATEDDVEFELAQHRDDELHDGRVIGARLGATLAVRNTACGQYADVFLTAADMRQLATRLLDLADRTTEAP